MVERHDPPGVQSDEIEPLKEGRISLLFSEVFASATGLILIVAIMLLSLSSKLLAL